MENNASALSVMQLVALVEAGKFPIGCMGSDDLAQRLYDAWSVLIARSCVHARQAAIARRDINQAMSEMGNNQGGYHLMERCLEQMKAQEGVDAPPVVLTMQLGEELREMYQEFDCDGVMSRLGALILAQEGMHREMVECDEFAMTAEESHAIAERIKSLRDTASLLQALMGFLPTEACKGVAS